MCFQSQRSLCLQAIELFLIFFPFWGGGEMLSHNAQVVQRGLLASESLSSRSSVQQKDGRM